MSYFEEVKETNSILKKLMILLKPLGMVTGAGSNRLSVDLNSGTVTTVTTVTTVATLTNQLNTGGVSSFVLAKDQARNAFANSIRNNLTF